MLEARVCGWIEPPKGRFQPDDDGTVTGHLAQVATSRPGSRARTVGPDQTIGSVRTQSARSPQYVNNRPIAVIDCQRYNCRSEALLVEKVQVREPPKLNPAYRPTHPPNRPAR